MRSGPQSPQTPRPTRLDDFTEYSDPEDDEFVHTPAWLTDLFDENDSVEEAVADLWTDRDPLWDGVLEALPTPAWHGTATDARPLVLTHVLRLAKGWKNASAIATYLEERPEIVADLGYESVDKVEQSKLWRAWEKRFPDQLKEYVEQFADLIVEQARENNVPAPKDVFRPSEDAPDEPSERTERELVSKHTKEVWQQAKPFVEDSFHLHRGENTQIPEGAWWEQHTYMGMRKDMYANAGSDSYRDDTSRALVPGGHHHREKLRMLEAEETREMLQNTTRTLVTRARHNSELVGNVNVAIDITKGHPWTGQVDRDDGDIAEEYILGYKDGGIYYQWASIQAVGQDIPLVLDVLPVNRGMKREDIVDELLSTAKDIVGGIELVMMDREFDTDPIKNVCESHGVYYLNPARKHSSERAMCTRLRRAGKTVHINQQQTIEGENRKEMYLPSTAVDSEPAVEDPSLADEESETTRKSENVRQEMIDDFESIGGDADGLSADEGGIGDVLDDMREEEEQSATVGAIEDKQAYTLFETNHPLVEVSDDHDDTERVHMVERIVRRYKQRWGIENGFKKIKAFMVRTSSKDHRYRFFNFAFASVLYNVWRLVDLLVKLAIDGENSSYEPKVDANRFLTHAKKYYGIPPPE